MSTHGTIYQVMTVFMCKLVCPLAPIVFMCRQIYDTNLVTRTFRITFCMCNYAFFFDRLSKQRNEIGFNTSYNIENNLFVVYSPIVGSVYINIWSDYFCLHSIYLKEFTDGAKNGIDFSNHADGDFLFLKFFV